MPRRQRRDRDAEVRAVTDELNRQMDQLEAVVSQFTALLLAATDPPGDDGERLVDA